MIVYQNKLIDKIFYGSTPIHKIYTGNNLVWRDTGIACTWGDNRSSQQGFYNASYNGFHSLSVYGGDTTNCLCIAVGFSHSVVVFPNGKMYASGNNYYGQLGLGNEQEQRSFQQVGTASNWVWAAAGNAYTVALNSLGELWGCGRNSFGSIGLGASTGKFTTLTQIGSATDWVTISAGNSHTAAINRSGQLWMCGFNENGQLGLGDTVNRTTLTRVGNDSDWVKVSLGDSHTAALKNNGTVYTWGMNYYGQLGHIANSTTPFEDRLTPRLAIADISDIASGGFHTMAITNDFRIKGTGYNQYGQLGLGNTSNYSSFGLLQSTEKWVRVAAGNNHTLFINSKNELFACGKNDFYQLGYYTGNITAPYKMSNDTTWIKCFAKGDNSAGLK